MSAPTALPYGMRDLKLTPYSDGAGTVLGTTSVDLPNMQTFSFSQSEEFQELRGDDRQVATRGKGAIVEWELEAGGITLQAWEIMSGGTTIESGIAPNRKWTLRKRSTAQGPYFRVEGKAISDSGGDVHAIVYRCRVTDSIEGEFADGEYFITSTSGQGMPLLLDDEEDILYDMVINETAVTIPTTPVANPPARPKNLAAGAVSGVSPNAQTTLTWTTVAGATSYNIQRKTGAGAYAAATPPTSATNSSTQTGLATGTWTFRVQAVISGQLSEWSDEVTVTVP